MDLRTQFIGYTLQNIGVKRKHNMNGMYIDLADEKTQNHLEYLYKKFGISPPGVVITKEDGRGTLA